MTDETAAKPFDADEIARWRDTMPNPFMQRMFATIDSQASALAEAKAEIERLKHALALTDSVAKAYAEHTNEQRARAEAAEARCAKLEAALGELLAFASFDSETAHRPPDSAEKQAIRMAETALASPSEPAGGEQGGWDLTQDPPERDEE